jgi:transglutaminase-like putative cysteine protease
MPGHRIILILIVIFLCSDALPRDPFNYFIEIKNYREELNREATSRYRLTSSDTDFSLLETAYQKVLRRYTAGGKTIIEVESGRIASPSTTIENTAEYLKDTRFLTLSSPEITGAASQLTGASDPLKAVEEFVFNHISDKTLGIPLIPAAQVYRLRRGDCTEHSVLAVALLRKAGIPGRAVVGMYLAEEFQGRKNIFVYHMWAEALWKGRWRLVDATRPGENRHNRYIAFAVHNLKAESPLQYLRAVSAIQDLTAEYITR